MDCCKFVPLSFSFDYVGYFRDSGNLRRHVKSVHSVRDKPVVCPRRWCEEEFWTLKERDDHKKSCLKICPTCSREFKWELRFKSHLRNHVAMNGRMIWSWCVENIDKSVWKFVVKLLSFNYVMLCKDLASYQCYCQLNSISSVYPLFIY